MQPDRDALMESSELCRQLSVGASPDAQVVLEGMASDFQRRAEVAPQDFRRFHRPSRRVIFCGALLLLTAAYFCAAYWFKALDPSMIFPKVRGRIVSLHRPFVGIHNSKFGVMAPDYWFGDLVGSLSHPCRSPVRIYENDTLLGPNHATMRSIGRAGMGRSEHWTSDDAQKLYGNVPIFFFSSSDNSDPRTNGRSYWAVLPEEVEPASACPASDPSLDEPEDDLFFAPPPSGELAILLGPSFERHGNAAVTYFVQSAELQAAARVECVGGVICSPLELYEDYVRLGPGQSTFSEIAEEGRGHFAHAPTSIAFSASDNSDPNTNGRKYWAVIPYKR